MQSTHNLRLCAICRTHRYGCSIFPSDEKNGVCDEESDGSTYDRSRCVERKLALVQGEDGGKCVDVHEISI